MRITTVGYHLRKVSTSFTRPNDATPYSIGDAVTNSTSAPVVFTLDLSDMLNLGGGLEIRKIAIVSSVKGAVLPIFNIFLSPQTYAISNDNAALDITDAAQENGGTWALCDLQNSTVSNARVAYAGVPLPLVLEGTSQKLYGVLQAANAYTPAANEKFTIVAWIAIL